MNRPSSIDPSSFQFKHKFTPTKRKSKSTLGGFAKKSGARSRHGVDLESSFMQRDLENIKIVDCENFMENNVFYIDKGIPQRKLLSQIALAMGATTKDTLDKSVTHVVHGPKKGNSIPRIIAQATARSIYKVSPKWLTTCYKEKKPFSPLLFPYDMDESREVLRLPTTIEKRHDPFGISDQLPDEEEQVSTAPKQRGIEQYFTIHSNTYSESETQSFGDVQEEGEEEEKAEDVERRKMEFEIRSKRIEEVIKARKEEMDRIAARESKDITQTPKKKKKRVPPENREFFAQDGLKIWYGEQSYKL